MDPKVLADALVEDGILEWFETVDGHDGSLVILPYVGLMPTEDAITDWRVAGKCLESMSEGGCCSYFGHDTTDTYLCTYRKGWGHRRTRFHGVDVNPCTAIIEAWYASTE